MTNLARRTVLGFAQLIVAMAIALFGPAGTLDYWQAWGYLVVFIGSAAIITLYLWRNDPGLLERRVEAGPAPRNNRCKNSSRPSRRSRSLDFWLCLRSIIASPGRTRR